jgi:heat shock protein HslJ
MGPFGGDSSLRHVLRFAAVATAALLPLACGRGGQTVGPTETSAVSPAAASLVGPTWRLSSLDGSAALPDVRVTAVFTEDKRVSGSAGCNGYFGRAAAAGGRLQVGLLGATLMYCNGEGVMRQEGAYMGALEKAAAYRLVGNELRLGPAPGVVTLVFRAE